MGISKKSSVKAQAFCSKLTGTEVAKSTTWQECTDIIYEHFKYVYDVYTHCKSMGDNTVIKIYKEPGEKEDLLEQFSIPNSEVFYEKDGDWDWPYIYRLLTEYFMKNWKYLTKGTKKKKKAAEKISVKDLMTLVAELKNKIKTSTGKEKKALIKEYNIKSVQLEKMMEQNLESQKQEPDKATPEELKKLRQRKSNLTSQIKRAEAAGKDTTTLKHKLEETVKQYNALSK